jgi:hypothetical protein
MKVLCPSKELSSMPMLPFWVNEPYFREPEDMYALTVYPCFHQEENIKEALPYLLY